MLAPLICQVALDDADWSQSAASAVRAGFAGVELAIRIPFNARVGEPHPALRSVPSAIEDAGVRIMSIFAEPSDIDASIIEGPQLAEHAVRWAAAALDAARQLGAATVAFDPFAFIRNSWASSNLDYDLTIRTAIEALTELRFEAQRRATQIVLAPAASGFLASPPDARAFVDRINSPWLRMALNVDAIPDVETPVGWVRALGRRIALVYLAPPQHAHGEIDSLVDALREIRFTGAIVTQSTGEPHTACRALSRVLARRHA